MVDINHYHIKDFQRYLWYHIYNGFNDWIKPSRLLLSNCYMQLNATFAYRPINALAICLSHTQLETAQMLSLARKADTYVRIN